MNNRDRDSVAKLLGVVADRLQQAPAWTLDRAISASGDGQLVALHQSGALEQICRNEASAIRVIVGQYLAQRPPKPRSKARGRR